jgi:hypothetical protein
MPFILTESHLRRVCEVNSFIVPQDVMVLFGLRGMLPANPEDHTFRGEQNVELADVNYLNPRCTLGQWLPKDRVFAVFPGSTVPHQSNIKRSLAQNGAGANQLMTGYYADYRKGMHKAGTPTGHEAFRQVASHPIRRTGDDLDFDNDDRVEFENPNDNIHAGWCMGVNHSDYSSAGCQVLVGFPECDRRAGQPATGPWKKFKQNAYDLQQSSFGYILLDGREVARVASAGAAKITPRLRFGSQGDLVRALQEALKLRGFYEGNSDGDLGQRTIRAILQFQVSTFGPKADDGIVGPQTASALGMSWPDR